MRTATITIAVFLLAGCESKPVSWWMLHDHERMTKIVACTDDPGLAHVDPDCINARAAQIQLMSLPGGAEPSIL